MRGHAARASCRNRTVQYRSCCAQRFKSPDLRPSTEVMRNEMPRGTVKQRASPGCDQDHPRPSLVKRFARHLRPYCAMSAQGKGFKRGSNHGRRQRGGIRIDGHGHRGVSCLLRFRSARQKLFATSRAAGRQRWPCSRGDGPLVPVYRPCGTDAPQWIEREGWTFVAVCCPLRHSDTRAPLYRG